MKKQWTTAEIECIKAAYAEGKREKVIAMELGRSESSVSKAITRYKIRSKRDYTALSRQSQTKDKKAARPIIAKTVRLDTTFNGNPCNWTSADEVLRYLGENHPHFLIHYQECKPIYKFHNIEVSLAKVLMETNKIRLSKGEPIFHLDEVTE
jgi:IS30 family transposase